MTKAIFFDIDGTLVSFQTHRMSDRLKDALREAQASGVKLIIASGRPLTTMNNLEGYPFDGYIAMNGVLTYLGGEVIDEHPIPKETALKAARFADERRIPCWVFTKDIAAVNLMNKVSTDFAAQINCFPEKFVDLEKVAEEEAVFEYSLFVDEKEEMQDLRPLLEGVEYPRWHPDFTDIVCAGISKAYGIRKVLERLGAAPEECMGFGDGGNDIPMLEYVGTGVAMGNAADEVKAAADYVTDTVDEDGIVTALRHFGIIN